MFSDRKSIRFFCIRTLRIRAMLNIECFMQQTINFEAQAQTRPAINVRATIQRKIKSINLWLDQKSEFYSRIAEFPVTRRLVLRVNAVSLCLMLSAIAAEQSPVVALCSTLSAGYLVYRFEKKGGRDAR